MMRLSEEEKVAQKVRRQQIKELGQSAEVRDLEGFNSLIDEMKKATLEDMYEAEMDTHLDCAKSAGRPEESDILISHWSVSIKKQSHLYFQEHRPF